jgi:iron complex outermembrane receptor protein
MLKSGIIAFACSISLCAHAVADSPKPVDVPAGALAQALELISKQAGVELVFRPEHVAGLRTRGVTGTLSAQEAVKRLLEGTPLQVRADEATGAMMIGRTPAPVAPPRRAPAPAEKTEEAAETSGRIEAPGTGRSDGFWSRFRVAQAGQPSRAESSVDSAARGNRADLEEVLVTGTHIRGVDNPTVPLTVIDRQFIDSTGMTTTVQLIESLPQNFALVNQTVTGGQLSGNSFSTIQGSSINLRGIGEGTTLTLVNGRRMPLGYDGSAVNVAGLPLSAMERVEVLTDGASALYGSDAVGGVVNFVFRKDFEGAESRASYGHADGTDDFRLSQAYGRSWRSGNFVVSGEYYSRDMLLASDRPYGSGGGASVGSLLPEDKTFAVTLSGRQDVGEGVEAFLDALYSDRDSHNKSFEVTPSSDADLYVDNAQLSINAGLAWDLGPTWRAEVSAGYGEDDLDVRIVDLLNFAPYGRTPILSKLTSVDAKADGALFELPGGVARVAIGAHWRQEQHDYGLQRRDLDQVLVEEFSFVRKRRVSSLFAEGSIPLIGEANEMRLAKRLDLSLAARYDDYSDFGSSVDPRIGLAWRPIQGVKLRGSWGTSYLAPKMKDFDTSFNATIAIDDFALADGRHLMQLSGNAPEQLRAQESQNYTFGIDFSPAALPGFTLSVNYYDIDYRDKIDNVDLIPFARLLGDPASFADLVILNPTVEQVNEAIAYGTQGQGFIPLNPDFSLNPDFDPTTVDVLLDLRRRNLGVVKQNGFDVSATYDFSAAGGNVHLGIDVAYIDEILKQVTATSAAFDVVDTYTNPTHLRARFAVGYVRGGWSVNTFVHRKNSYIDDRLTPLLASIDSYTTVDLTASYRFAQNAGLFSGVSVMLSALNLLDEDPPSAVARGTGYYDLGFDSTNASPLGRLVTFDLTKRW